MENAYILIIVALAILASIDLVVGVSNDAVNFLNSAIGSKAFSLRTILITASIGIAIGAIFSSGMMEVARKGIFNPENFYFNEIIIIFLAVMITDVLLLDFFNSVGMPTSTTVSIVFELLGAAVVMAFIKMSANDQGMAHFSEYINTSKATAIILGILLSVIIAFSIGLFVQWVTRMLLSYDYLRKPSWVGIIFGTVALTAITYFILLKGIKGTPWASNVYSFTNGEELKNYVSHNTAQILGIFSGLWLVVSFLIISVFKFNIYKVIILVGTFALSLAFAGNDLVNFVGVPIAAWQSYEIWYNSDVAPSEFSMGVLQESVKAPTIFLLISGLIMVVTLWFSKKAMSVTETEINLAREGEANERFEPNYISRGIVRFATTIANSLGEMIPNRWNENIEQRFQKPVVHLSKKKNYELPAFDLLRAAVNLTLAAILISMATSMKLPLSTTYVTFMVAMGTSLADRAWNSESAVYRVAGVLNVIGGWFFTAIIAFVAAGTVAYLIFLGGQLMIAILFLLTILLLVRSYVAFKNKGAKSAIEEQMEYAESKTLTGVISESAQNIAKVAKRGRKIYLTDIDGLSSQDLSSLKKNKKQVLKLNQEIDDLRDNIFYFIKNQEDATNQASNFYIHALAYLQDMAQSLELISNMSYKHINNNHKKLNAKQVSDLKDVEALISGLFNSIRETFETENYDNIDVILSEKNDIIEKIQKKIDAQIERTRLEESSPKNTTLYFSILIETKDLVDATFDLLAEYSKNLNR